MTNYVHALFKMDDNEATTDMTILSRNVGGTNGNAIGITEASSNLNGTTLTSGGHHGNGNGVVENHHGDLSSSTSNSPSAINFGGSGECNTASGNGDSMTGDEIYNLRQPATSTEDPTSGTGVMIHYDVNDPDLTCNRENPDESDAEAYARERAYYNDGGDEDDNENDGNKPHNRSHDSIESQRTIIEADDFSSFLAQDDDDDDFGDEEVNDEDLGFGDDGGGFDFSNLMSSSSNQYMLDFTSSSMLGAESELEGNDEDDDDIRKDDDGTISGESREDGSADDGHSTPRDKNNTSSNVNSNLNRDSGDGGHKHTDSSNMPRGKSKRRKSRHELEDEASRGVMKARSWVKASAPYHNSQERDDHDYNSYTDTLRKQTGKNNKYDYDSDDDPTGSPPRNFREEINNNVLQKSTVVVVPPLMLSSSSSSLSNNLSSTVSPLGHAVLPSMPTAPFSPKKPLASVDSSSDLAAALSPRYTQQKHHNQHQLQQVNLDCPTSPLSFSKVPARFQAYEYETPLRTNRFSSGSMENLLLLSDRSHSQPQTHTHEHSSDTGRSHLMGGVAAFENTPNFNRDLEHHNVYLEQQLLAPNQRRNSMPNLYDSLMDSLPATLCRNCQFSRDDYIFKIR